MHITNHLQVKRVICFCLLFCLIFPSISITKTKAATYSNANYDYAYEVLTLVNQERAKVGLSPLTMDQGLLDTAMLRANEITSYFSHTRPDGTTCFTAFPDGHYGYYYIGENIAMGQISPSSVMTSWMNSSGHKENILKSQYKSIGIGCIKANGCYYWVQCFSSKNATPAVQTQTETWKKENDKWTYICADGTTAKGWKKINQKWYYFNSSGYMVTGWQQISGIWYSFADSGAMRTGWYRYGNEWYYLKPSGAMATGWYKVSGTWYYFYNYGGMKTGWLKDNGNWYYLDTNGAMHRGWLQIEGKWYYFYDSGAMAANTTINGYHFDANGVYIQ